MPQATSRAAEGYDRRSFTVAEILAMQEAGIIDESENFELIEGEIIPMSPKLHIHERIESTLAIAMAKACPDDLAMGFVSSTFLSPLTFIEPDISLYPVKLRTDEVKGPDIILAIEVAASSLAYDRGLKARIYARYGVRELWVIDAVQRRTFINTGPVGDGWTSIAEHASDFVLTIPALPGFSIQLSAI